MVLYVTDREQHKRSACLENEEQVNSEQSGENPLTVTL